MFIGDVNWQNLRAGNTRSCVELGSISSRCSGDEPRFSPTVLLKHQMGESEEIELIVGLTQ